MLRFVLALGLLTAGGAHAQAPRSQAQDGRHRELERVYDDVSKAHGALGEMISSCSGGRVMVIACRPPSAGRPCEEQLVSCDVVSVFRSLAEARRVLKSELAN